MPNLFGAHMDLLVSNSTSLTQASFVKKVNFQLPYSNSNYPTFSNGNNLFQSKMFNSSVAMDLDAWAPLWQQYSIFLINGSSNPNIDADYLSSVMGLFPWLIDLRELQTNPYIIISDPNSPYYGVIYGSASESYRTRMYFYDKSTENQISYSQIPNIIITSDINLIYLGLLAYRNGSCYGVYKTGRMTGNRNGTVLLDTNVNPSAIITYLLSNGEPNYKPVPDDSDPYAAGGSSETGGGTGDFDGTSDSIDIPNLPTLSAVDTGFISLFNPSASQLKSLANYMWGNLFDIDTWKKIFANPMDAILGLSIVPVNVPGGESETVSVGNISTGISMTKASSQYVAVDCGTLNVNEYWGAYLDYDPYTKAEIYLPFIGAHPLAVDDIMGKSVHVVYHVDILSGSCCAYIKCGDSVLYSFVGQCSCSIPITGNDWTNVINGALSIAASIGTMVATGGASAPMSIPSIASTSVNSLKPNVERSGSMGGMGGMLGTQKPYLILTRPRQARPTNQNAYMGYPAFITMELSDCAGYTEIESIHLDNVPATERELEEIETLLKSGVII